MRRDDTNLSQKTQRKKLSQRFTNNPHVGTFGSYKQHNEEFTMLPSANDNPPFSLINGS